MPVEAFSLPFSQPAVDDLRERLARTRWPDPSPYPAWESGTDLTFLQEIRTAWRTQFDWQAQLERLSALPHFRYSTADAAIHFVHVRGRGSNPLPLILTHGWPGSFLEMLRIIPLLTQAEDSFDVVVPSLPGFGFSGRPAAPGMNLFRIADLWAELMSELGYRQFGAQGGDLGAGVSTALGLRHPDRLLGIHLNYIPGSYRPHLDPAVPLTEPEQAFLRDAAQWADQRGAYAHLQRTRPLTAAYGLTDSPAALAAWILEKFRDWSDCDGDVYRSFTREELLTNLTLYWMTGTIHSSFRLYYESRLAPLAFGPADFVRVPCAIARFPREAPFPPRSWVERGYNVRRWTTMPRGGHFAAAEEPELLARDLREFYRQFR
jgi:pimeloyl-ACP methyl ester carboxylesterase